jgi:alpha-tubulin suppressor-like RCC1 family protein
MMDRVRLWAIALLAACKYSSPSVGGGDDAPLGDDAPVHDAPLVDANACAAVEIAASGAHTCARLGNGSVWCWGDNDRGEVGVASIVFCNTHRCQPSPVQVSLPAASALGLGDQHTCAVATGGDVYCWGANDMGQFGNNLVGDAGTPTLIAQRAGSMALVGGQTRTCSLQNNGVTCSGLNQYGDVGDGTMSRADTPVSVISLPTITAIGTGFNHTCGIANNGDLYCWGLNTTVEITNSGSTVPTPIHLTGVSKVTQVAGGSGHTCALVNDKTAHCRGSNSNGQLGLGTIGGSGAFGKCIVDKVDAISAGANHTCFLSAGAVSCVGEGYDMNPVAISLPHAATSIASGSYHACAILDDGTVYCWGINVYGQLGNGSSGTGTGATGVHAMLCR